MSVAKQKRSRSSGAKDRVDIQRATAARLRAKGLTLAAIGERLGVSKQRVHQILRPVQPNLCRACGGAIRRRLQYHLACRPSNYKPTGRPRGPARRHPVVLPEGAIVPAQVVRN